MKTLGTHNYYVYILTNKSKTVLYIGITNNIQNRMAYHAKRTNRKSFTSKYNCFFLIYIEQFNDVNTAIKREKQLKGWSRKKKEALIQITNPNWTFLNDTI